MHEVHVSRHARVVPCRSAAHCRVDGSPFLPPAPFPRQLTDPDTGAVTCELGVNVLPGASNYLFQIGDTFLRKYYAYFVAGDKMFGDNPRIGYAPAVHT